MANKLEYILSLKDQFTSKMRSAEGATSKLDSKMSKLGGMIAGAFAVGGVVNFGNAVIESLKKYEYFHASLNTMMKGNKQMAGALETQLMTLAKTTPFELTEIQASTKQLLAYGFRAGEVVNTMKTLGDVSAGIGAPLGDIAYLYGTLKTSGRVTLMDLRQFAGRGIPIYETLAKRLKTTTNEINNMVSAGKIGFKDIEGAFSDMTKQGGQFFNLMEDQSKTVGGKLSNLSDVWEQIRVNIGKSQTGIIASTVDFINSMSNKINDKLAAGNFMDEAFKAGGVSNYSGLTSFYGNLAGLKNIKGLAGDFAGMKDQAMYMQSLIEQSTTGLKAKQNLDLINLNKTKLEEKYRNKEVDATAFAREMSLYNAAFKGILGNLQILKQKGEVAQTDENGNPIKTGTKESKSIGTGIDVVGTRPQSLVININELVHELKVSSTNLTEGVMKIKEEMAKVLLEVVNDVNYAVR